MKSPHLNGVNTILLDAFGVAIELHRPYHVPTVDDRIPDVLYPVLVQAQLPRVPDITIEAIKAAYERVQIRDYRGLLTVRHLWGDFIDHFTALTGRPYSSLFAEPRDLLIATLHRAELELYSRSSLVVALQRLRQRAQEADIRVMLFADVTGSGYATLMRHEIPQLFGGRDLALSYIAGCTKDAVDGISGSLMDWAHRRLGVNPETSLAIESQPVNVALARDRGCRTGFVGKPDQDHVPANVEALSLSLLTGRLFASS
jgi:hypothetical protein